MTAAQWNRTPSALCPARFHLGDELVALVDRGWARSETVKHGQRTRTVYQITPAGQRALRTWLTAPVRGTALECEPLLRVFLGDLAGDAGIRSALGQVRADAGAILDVGRRVATEYLTGTAPFQDQVHLRAFVFDFLSNHAMMLREWADRTEQSLDRWPAQTSEQRAAAALDTIREIRDHYPATGPPR